MHLVVINRRRNGRIHDREEFTGVSRIESLLVGDTTSSIGIWRGPALETVFMPFFGGGRLEIEAKTPDSHANQSPSGTRGLA